jgi:TRAP-type C4-dicarboxylate transport system permease small subunit
MKNIKTIGKIADTINKYVVALILAVMTISISIYIVLRYFFSITFVWSDEITMILFVYLVFLSIPIALRMNEHVTIDWFVSRFPQKPKKLIMILVDLLMFIIIYLFLTNSIELIKNLGSNPYASLHLPVGILYLAITLSSLIMLVDMMVIIYKHIMKPVEDNNK